MPSHDTKATASAFIPLADSRANHQSEFKGTAKNAGDTGMEPRVTELETHLKYIRRDMDEVRGDVKAIKHRLAYSAGAAAVVMGLVGWVANSRFDQLVALLAR
ncbi:hypothetical protein ACOI9X_00250 [Pseudomonas sp. P2757]|uniref:hypothetical protein n=1 Tax=unclassified Pseudomonas TaxID=196821 RepID=UPI003B5A01EC